MRPDAPEPHMIKSYEDMKDKIKHPNFNKPKKF